MIMQSNEYRSCRLLVWYLDFARVDAVDDVVRRLPIDRAPDALCSSQNLFCAAGQVL